MNLYKIGQAAAMVGTTTRTLKWYEELDLLPKGERTPGGFRLYSDHDIEIIQRIQKMQGLGFSLQTIREVLQHQSIIDRMGRKRLPTAKLLELHGNLQRQRDELAGRIEKLRRDLAAGEELLGELEHDLDILSPVIDKLLSEEADQAAPTP